LYQKGSGHGLGGLGQVALKKSRGVWSRGRKKVKKTKVTFTYKKTEANYTCRRGRDKMGRAAIVKKKTLDSREGVQKMQLGCFGVTSKRVTSRSRKGTAHRVPI